MNNLENQEEKSDYCLDINPETILKSKKGGKINESVYYLSEKDYGVLTRHIRNLYRRLRTRIDDDSATELDNVCPKDSILATNTSVLSTATG